MDPRTRRLRIEHTTVAPAQCSQAPLLCARVSRSLSRRQGPTLFGAERYADQGSPGHGYYPPSNRDGSNPDRIRRAVLVIGGTGSSVVSPLPPDKYTRRLARNQVKVHCPRTNYPWLAKQLKHELHNVTLRVSPPMPTGLATRWLANKAHRPRTTYPRLAKSTDLRPHNVTLRAHRLCPPESRPGGWLKVISPIITALHPFPF